MKLLLDEMWSPEIAVQLRRLGHDVSAVAERPELRGLPDALILAAAAADGRAIVTNDIRDFRELAAVAAQGGHPHAGIIFTANRRFPRHDRRTLGRVVSTLEAVLLSNPDMTNLEIWL